MTRRPTRVVLELDAPSPEAAAAALRIIADRLPSRVADGCTDHTWTREGAVRFEVRVTTEQEEACGT